MGAGNNNNNNEEEVYKMKKYQQSDMLPESIKIGFTKRNTYILAILTISFIVGEISHFLLGVVSQDMARSLHYGDKSCFLHSNDSLRFGRTNSECETFSENNGGKKE